MSIKAMQGLPRVVNADLIVLKKVNIDLLHALQPGGTALRQFEIFF